MAEREQEVFLPEKVDEQVDTYLAASTTDEQALDLSAHHAVQVLQRHLAPEGQDAALQRVWQRFEQERATMSQRELAQQHATTRQKRRYPMNHVASESLREKRGTRLARRLSLIAAVIVVALLVGSAAVLFRRPSGGPASTHTGTPGQPAAKEMFVLVDRTLSRLDIKTHQPLWHFQAPAGTDGSAGSFPIPGEFVHDTYYILDLYRTGERLYVLNAATGKIRWQVDYRGQLMNPLISDDTVYLNVEKDGYTTIDALNRNSGALRWEHRLGKASDGNTGVTTNLFATSEKAVYGELFSGKNVQRYALSAQDGNILWQKNEEIANVKAVQGFVLGNVLVMVKDEGVGVRESFLQGYNAASGKELWRKPLDGYAVQEGTTVLNGIIYVNTMRMQWHQGTIVYAFAMSDGTPIWQYNDADVTGSTYPTVTEGGVYLYRYDGKNRPELTTPLVALDTKTGKVRWIKNFAPATFEYPPAADTDQVYLSLPGNVVQIVGASDGKPLDSFKVSGKVDPSNGVLVQVVG